MTVIYHEHDADRSAIAGSRIAIVGYGEQGAAWARNLRDSGRKVIVCTREGPSAERANRDGFTPHPVGHAADTDILCLCVPDGVIRTLPIEPAGWALTIVGSGAPLATGTFDPNGDVGFIAPRIKPAEVRRRFLSGDEVVSALGVHHDRTGQALARLLAVARDLGALRGGAIEMSAAQEALLALAVEQALRPELERICTAFLQAMLEHGVPLEALISELVIGGDLPGIARLLRPDLTSASSDPSRVRIGAELRRIVDDLAAGRMAGTADADGVASRLVSADLRLGALLEGSDISPEELVIDLRARLGLTA